jgi:hypothetical protein
MLTRDKNAGKIFVIFAKLFVVILKNVNDKIILLKLHILSFLNYLLTVNSLYLLCSGQEKDVEVIKDTLLDGYTNSFFTCSVSKLGYSGTAIISRVRINYPMPHTCN